MKNFIFILLAFVLFSPAARAADCPFGVENDPAPGQCRIYTDKNGDEFCDYGEEKVVPVAKTAVPDLADNKAESKKTSAPSFYLGEILGGFIFFQGILLLLLRRKKISMVSFRKINNYGLLISFVLTIISTAPFLLRYAGVTSISNFQLWNFLHTDGGFVMILFSIEHTARRWRSFLPIKKLIK